MGLQNGTGAERQIGMDIVCLQNGTGAETPKQIDEIRNQIPKTRKLIPETRKQMPETPKQIDRDTVADTGNPESDSLKHGSR